MATDTPELETLNESAYHLLKRAAQYAADLYMDEVGNKGLTQRQYTVLLAVEHDAGISQTRLVRQTGIDRSTLAEMISRLADQGYVVRRRSRNDARINLISLTQAGRRALKRAKPGAGEVDEKILSAIPASRRKTFLNCLKALAANAAEPAGTAEKPRAKKAGRKS